jgi:hypothetical protein
MKGGYGENFALLDRPVILAASPQKMQKQKAALVFFVTFCGHFLLLRG